MGPEAKEDSLQLLKALSAAAEHITHLRSERAVLDAAGRHLLEQGFDVAVRTLDGSELVLVLAHWNPTRAQLPAPAEDALIKPRVRTQDVAAFQRAFQERRAQFQLDARSELPARCPPEYLEEAYRLLPRRCVDAPLFVDRLPYGMITAFSDSLTAIQAAAIDLFARHVSAAVENVRHHLRLAEQLDELIHMQRDRVVQERLAALGEAAAVVSHEVRNPLGAVLNAVALLRRQRASDSDRTMAVSIIEEEASRLDRLVRDLLDVARPMEPRVRLVNAQQLIEQTARVLKERDPKAAISVLPLQGDAPALSADPNLLSLALENLMRNALQAAGPHGRVEISVGRRNGRGLVVVEDSGPGIPVQDRSRIFEPFFTTRATGTGLGLAVVKRVIVAHRGEVSVTAGALGGARFEILLPLETS